MNALRLAWRFLCIANLRLLATIAWRCGIGNVLAIHRFQRRLRKGVVFPPFLFLSITSRCNLRCQGCWVHVDGPPSDLTPQEIDSLIEAAHDHGSRFFGLLGGEPLLHPHLWDVLAKHRTSYFQLFTNGTLLTAEHAQRMRQLGNITPLISVEGSPAVSDERRGGSNVLGRTWQAIEHCTQAGLITGVATSLCQSNIDDLLTEKYLDELIDRNVLYAWYYIYRPAGQCPNTQLALTAEQIIRLRRFLVEMRSKKPIVLVDSYWDHDGNALCPAATGISHHISPYGDIEPCPPIQFSAESIRDGEVGPLVRDSAFLAQFRKTIAQKTRGCILLEDPDALATLVESAGAHDSSGRNVGLAELQALPQCPGHHQPGCEIPETDPIYRFAKKHWFFGFGAYG